MKACASPAATAVIAGADLQADVVEGTMSGCVGATLSDGERRELVGAMDRIRRLLGDATTDRTFTLRDPEPGDIGWIVHRQARLYSEEYGWDWTFEALLAEIAGQFIREFQPGRERC